MRHKNAAFSDINGFSGWGLLIAVFSALRLAKFNVDTKQSDSFIGMPTPANAILWASLLLISELRNDINTYSLTALIDNKYFLLILTFATSLLMVAPLPLFALKFKNFSWADNKIRYIFLVLAVALIAVLKFVGIPFVIVAYILLSVVNNFTAKGA